MNEALLKTLELLMIITLGYFLQRKISDQKSLNGIKTLILSVALPATIFLALLKINLESTFLYLPLLALFFNLIMLGASIVLVPRLFPTKDESLFRTRSLLLPSLAPGLSCFPFIVAYLGEDNLALAALADVGNKFFGLILLFFVAMYWFRRRSIGKNYSSQKEKVKHLFLSLASEPINLVIGVALLLLSLGFQLDHLPVLFQNIIAKLSLIMVPLILLFIGLSVRISIWKFIKISQLLTWRSGFAFVISGVFLSIIPEITLPLTLIIIVFPQSSCSFWPFAHMCTVAELERKEGQPSPTFNQSEAINMLACSLPFSTCIIISIFYFGHVLTNPLVILGLGFTLLLISVFPSFLSHSLKSTIRSGFPFKYLETKDAINDESLSSVNE